MAQKPEIQYIGQFYVYGSEAKELAQKNEQKKAKKELPLPRFEHVRKVYVDPLAIGSILVAAVLLITMVSGVLAMQTAQQELETAQQYVYELKEKNRELAVAYRSGYDLEQIRAAALGMGMIPMEEAQVMSVRVTVPVQKPEPTWLDDMVWFLSGLFE